MRVQEQQERGNGRTVRLTVRGMDCPDCAVSLERAVKGVPGVSYARLVYSTALLRVESDMGEGVIPAVRRVAERMGYELVQETADQQPQTWRTWLATNRQTVLTAASGPLVVAGLVAQLLGVDPLASRVLFGAAIISGGYYLARAGLVALWTAHSLDMNVLMMVAAIGAMAVGEFAEGAVTVFLFSIGELLESYTSDRARNAIRALMDLAPAEATVQRDGHTAVVPVEDLVVGDRVLVRPGERLPADGRVVEGQSEVNQAPITGESVPVAKSLGSEVFAGTMNGSGVLTVEVTRPAEDSSLARILALVEEAQSERAPTQRWVDRFAGVYTPIVIGLAALVAAVPPLLGLGALSTWVYRALVLLVISCPCALVISTPVTLVSALTRAARGGVLIKGGRHLEALGGLKAIAFDKTGTLTVGEPYVVGGSCEYHTDPRNECKTCSALLAKAAALEGRSEHALARAVMREAEAQGLLRVHSPGQDIVAHAGLGIEGRVEGHRISAGSPEFSRRSSGPSDAFLEVVHEAQEEGHTVVVIEDACCGQRCYLSIADNLREGAAKALRELKSAGVGHTVMLTGDNAHIARLIARRAGVDEYYAGLLPQDKVDAVERLLERFGSVAMVGDGVNDAPALARATVGIAMGAAGTDAALETADVALMGDDLSKVPFAVRLSRAALRLVRANVALSLAIKGAFLVLAVIGLSTLWMAVLADTGASVLVTLNGMRMLRFPEA